MRVVDTSLWIEYAADSMLADQAEKLLKPLATCIVPAMVHYELTKWCLREVDDQYMRRVQSLLTECVNLDMDLVVADEAARLSLKHKLRTTDAIIYATACVQNVRLYTCDSHFKDLPHVEYLEK
jgi:predicted nucleic acid-binding protein